MNEQLSNPGLQRPGIPVTARLLLIGLAALVVVSGAVLGMRALTPRPAPALAAVGMPISPAIEQRWGIRVTQIGVTADGGLVDFRFVVLDADKAFEMMKDVNSLPVLITEDSKHVLINSAAAMAAKHDLRVGGTYFLLYRNSGGAIKSGSAVTVRFGDLTLAHVRAL